MSVGGANFSFVVRHRVTPVRTLTGPSVQPALYRGVLSEPVTTWHLSCAALRVARAEPPVLLWEGVLLPTYQSPLWFG